MPDPKKTTNQETSVNQLIQVPLLGNPSVPLDIFWEIVSYLDAAKLAQLTGLSKVVRNFIESKPLNEKDLDNRSDIKTFKSLFNHKREKYVKFRKLLKLDGGFFNSLFKNRVFLSHDSIDIFTALIFDNDDTILKKLFYEYIQFHNPTAEMLDKKISVIFELISTTIEKRKVACLQAIISVLINNKNIRSAMEGRLSSKIYLLTVIGKSYWEFIKPLRQLGCDISQALNFALLNGNKEAVRLLVMEKYDSDKGITLSTLKDVIYDKDNRLLNCLAEFCFINVNERDASNTTALHFAVDQLNEWAVRVLLVSGADPTIQSDTLGLPIDIVRKKSADQDKDLCQRIEIMLNQYMAKQLLNAINHSLGLETTWEVTVNGAKCRIKPQKKEFFDEYRYSLLPILIVKNELVLRIDELSINKILQIQSNIEAHISAQLSSANQKTSDKSPTENNNIHIGPSSLPSVAENTHLFSYDAETQDEPAIKSQVSMRTNCNN